MRSRFLLLFLTILFVGTSYQAQAAAKSKYLFKIASLAPAGSVWVTQFENFAKEVTEQTGGEVGFRIYPGGVMGDDQAMFRKMRVGQLHGAGLTMTGIARKVPDFRVLAIPFLFESYAEVDHVMAGLLEEFKAQFRNQGLEFIAVTEVGFIYAMSTKDISTFKTFQQTKNWSPAGDPISDRYFAALGITPVRLSIPDVTPSLQSGLVETVYNSLYGAIVMQWFAKTRYVVDLPYGYAYGAFALDRKQFAKLPETHQQAIYAAAEKHFPILLAKTRESNRDSRKILEQRGNSFKTLDNATIKLLHDKRDETIEELVPQAFSQKIKDRTFSLLEQFRNP